MTEILAPRRLLALAGLGCLGLLAGALLFQYLGGLQPCPLCIWQRWPHAVAVALAALLLSACAGPGYYTQAIAGHLDLMSKRQDVAAVLADELSQATLDKLNEALAGCSRVVVIEQNHGGQLYHHLLGHCDSKLESLALPGPVPLDPAAIVHAIAGREAA